MTDIEKAEASPLTWDPIQGGKRAWVSFEDDRTFDLGPDLTGQRFQKIADQMLSGHYYPSDAIRTDGRFRQENRLLKPKDRVLQYMPLLGRLERPRLKSAVEIVAAEQSPNRCYLSYVTTRFHVGRGIWSAELTRQNGQLQIHVKSTTNPQSWLYWIMLPIARAFQLRARRRAIQEFRKITN